LGGEKIGGEDGAYAGDGRCELFWDTGMLSFFAWCEVLGGKEYVVLDAYRGELRSQLR
jgi:hypothetical protein